MAQVGLNDEKNWMSKISLDWPFKNCHPILGHLMFYYFKATTGTKNILLFQLYGEKEGMDSEVETEVKKKGDRVTTITKRIPKKARIEEEEEGVMDTGLSLEDDEDLALRLLAK